MKAFILFLSVAACAFPQAYRINSQALTTASNTGNPGNQTIPYPQVLAIPNAAVSLYTTQQITTLATTYSDATGTIPCPATQQITLEASNACVSYADPQGNFGFWVAAGTYWFTITSNGNLSVGPYPVSVGGGSGGGGTTCNAIPIQEYPSGTPNGVLTTFNLSLAPVAATLNLQNNGVSLVANIDYELNGNVITFLTGSIPQTGDILYAKYFFMGATGSCFGNGNYVDITNFTFSQTPGGLLTGGSTANVTLAPCPYGVNGTDTKHYLYVANGTGTAESVLITGGTCTAGSSSGTVIFTPVYSHSGLWTISSATNGMTEAEYYLPSGGGTVVMPAGAFQMYAPIPYLPHVIFSGAGVGTKILPSSCSAIVFDSDVPVKPTAEYTLDSDSVGFSNFLIEGAQCVGANTITGIREINQSGSTEVWSLVGVLIDGVYFDNIRYAVNLYRSDKVTLNKVQAFANTTFVFADSSYGLYNSTDISMDGLIYTWRYMNGTGSTSVITDSMVTCYSCEVFHFTNARVSANLQSMTPIINMVGGEDSQFLDNEFETFYYGIYYSPLTLTGGSLVYPGYSIVIGNSFDNVWGTAIIPQSGTGTTPNNQVHDLVIRGNLFTNPNNTFTTPYLINLQPYTRDVTIGGNVFNNLSANGETAVVVGLYTDNIRFDSSNIFSSAYATVTPTTTGVYVNSQAYGVYGLQGITCVNFTVCVNDAGSSIPSASTITLPVGRSQVTVTGTTGISSIVAAAAGTTVNLLFPNALTVTNGGNIKIGSNFTTTGTATDILTLYCDGTNWIQIARAAN